MTDLGGQDLRPVRNAPAPRGAEGATAGEPPPPETRMWQAELSRVIEGEILPRLLLAHDCSVRPDPNSPPPDPGDLDIAEFARRLCGAEPGPAWEFVEAARRMGRPMAEVFLEVLTPTARYLGKLWETDHCDFVEVTVGLRRLQEILGGSARRTRLPAPGSRKRRARCFCRRRASHVSASPWSRRSSGRPAGASNGAATILRTNWRASGSTSSAFP